MEQYTCIVCPKGCMIVVAENGGISGAGCERGTEYVKEEMKNPTRMLTSTVRITGSSLPRLPVKTSMPIPKSKVMHAARILNDIEVAAPVESGEVLLRNILDTGADIIATKSTGKHVNWNEVEKRR